MDLKLVCCALDVSWVPNAPEENSSLRVYGGGGVDSLLTSVPQMFLGVSSLTSTPHRLSQFNLSRSNTYPQSITENFSVNALQHVR